MSNNIHSALPADELDELVAELLGCGAVLSQMISQMVRFEASGRSAPDVAPIPEVAHSLLRDALGDLRKRHSKRDLRVATAIVSEATKRICDDIFMVDPEWIDEILGDGSDTELAGESEADR